jgi:hypothetical protein
VAIPAIFNQLIIVMFFFSIFAIIGVNLFKGRHEFCIIDHTGLTTNQIQTLIHSSEDCFNYGGEWSEYYSNFNSIGPGIRQIISMSQTVNWMFEMYHTTDSRGPGFTPRPKTSLASSIFYVVTVFFCSFFVVNMFVGVVVSAYNRESERLGKKFLLTEN